MSNIDRNRGCMIRHHRSGVRVVMYMDQPGVYYDENGHEVDEGLAKAVGYDVEANRNEGRKQQVRRRFEKLLDQQFSESADLVDRIADGDTNIKVTKTANGRFHIYNSDGDKLSKNDMSEEEAALFYEAVTGKPFKSSGGKSTGSGALTKPQIIEQLNDAGVEHDPAAKKGELQALLEKHNSQPAGDQESEDDGEEEEDPGGEEGSEGSDLV